jgi:sirohydrochlorin ferrochelatase
VVSVHDTDVAWEALAGLDGTLVLLMGVGRLTEAARGLVDAGRSADTPVAVVENGTTPQQRTTVATLADIAKVAEARGVRSPAVVVVGEVVRLASALEGCQAVRAPERPERLTAPVVLAAHGSPDPRHAETVGQVAEALRRRGRAAVVGWLGHSSPTLADAVKDAGAGAVVVPFLLAPAFHARQDVPAGSGAARVADVLVPEGEPDARLVQALTDRLAEPGGGYDAVVLAAVGSRDPAHAAAVQRVASALATSLNVHVEPAYATAGPALGDAVAKLGRPAQRIAVAALFLAPGVLHDRVVAEASLLGLAAVAGPLGAHPDVVDLLVARADAAR